MALKTSRSILENLRVLRKTVFLTQHSLLLLYTQHVLTQNPDITIIIISNLSNDRSKASSKTIPPHSAI